MQRREDPELLTPQEAAALLQVPLRTLQQWIREGKVPILSRKGRRYVHRQDVERFGTEARELAAAQAVNRLLALFTPKLRMIFHWRNGRERGIAPAEWPEGIP